MDDDCCGSQDVQVTKRLNFSDKENSGKSQNDCERVIRKRKRKSSDQIKTLIREFDKNPNWTKETLLDVSRKTGLSEA